MGTPEATIWGGVTTAAAVLFVIAGALKMKRARLIADTPTTSAADPQSGERIEIQGRVVAAERTIETLTPGKRAVWHHLNIEKTVGSGEDSTTRTILADASAVEFYVDDGSGRLSRVIPVPGKETVKTLPSASIVSRELVIARLHARHVDDFDPAKLTWTEQALYVGDPVYVLGRGEVTTGPPAPDGYRGTVPTRQLRMEGTPSSPLLIAAMTEERLVHDLRNRGAVYFGCASILALLAVAAMILGLATTVLDCSRSE